MNVRVCMSILALCAACAEAPEPGHDEAAIGLRVPQVSDWAYFPYFPDRYAFLGAQLATLDGTTYAVMSDQCGSWSCTGDYRDLYWSKLTPEGWTGLQKIVGQRSKDRVSLASYNGFLYMVHTGEDYDVVWISRFDPATEEWTPNRQLPLPTFGGPPAIAAFDGRLHFVGTDEDCQMWQSSMNEAEQFSLRRPLYGHATCYRPSLAVYDGRLYVAHSDAVNGYIRFGSRAPGTSLTWTNAYVRNGAGGTAMFGLEPTIAATQGYLHLTFRYEPSNLIWWSYFNGCAWTVSQTLNTFESSTATAMTEGGLGLYLAYTGDWTWNGLVQTRSIRLLEFTAPPPPLFPPATCGTRI